MKTLNITFSKDKIIVKLAGNKAYTYKLPEGQADVFWNQLFGGGTAASKNSKARGNVTSIRSRSKKNVLASAA